jgi:hypothetical protein
VIIEQNEKSVKEREENLIEMAQDIYKKWTLGGD